MKRPLTTAAVIGTLLLGTLATEAADTAEKSWPAWRGPDANGVSETGTPPVQWSETENIHWKIEIPGKGHASPVVWGNMIIVLTAVEGEIKDGVEEAKAAENKLPMWRKMMGKAPGSSYRFVVMAIDRTTGKVIWEKTVREEVPHEGIHNDGSWASNSPVTDGERIYAYFGSRGLYCLDMSGKIIWQKEFGRMSTKMAFGEGSSPALSGNRLIVVWDHEGKSFITALEKATGKELWRSDRDEKTSWATPAVINVNGREEIIASATKRIRSYDPASGALIWECAGMTANVIPTPVYYNGIIYAASGFQGNALLAIRPDNAKGDISDSAAIIWKHAQDTPYVPSILLYADNVWFLKGNDATLSVLNAKTGAPVISGHKLSGLKGVYASPVAAAGYVYITGRNGVTAVIKASEPGAVVAENVLNDQFSASAAIVDKEIILRGFKYLYDIALPR
ncbi:MAG: PQQ-like beta-propeller repeat protein [Spirochaetes bacterium]|nr:PQQ-like beta-propeller repeat protein [Spirochaetota bacterium]